MKVSLAPRTLTFAKPRQGVAASAFVYDPAKPVRTMGGTNLILPKGIRDHRPQLKRGDVVAFTGEPLAKDMRVVGRLRAHLWVSSSAPDTDFTAALFDVRPDGYRANIQDGIVRLRYRNGRGKPSLVMRDEIVAVDIDLWSTAYVFRAGHRLALHVSSSNFPRFDRHLNVAAKPWEWAAPQKATNLVHHDAARPSFVELPVVD